ncbi:hypothetical protein CYMTET_42518, partial [Cymbomonas tetramitiformis]
MRALQLNASAISSRNFPTYPRNGLGHSRKQCLRSHSACKAGAKSFQNPLGSLFGGSRRKLTTLKEDLLTSIDGTNCGASASPEEAEQVDTAVQPLEARSVNMQPTSGPLTGRWRLEYTTEADVHAFLNRKLLGLPVVDIGQEIDLPSQRITNNIDLAAGISIQAGAPLEISSGQRIAYFFDWFALKIGKFELKVPLKKGPGGWTEATYCDDDMRIMRNSRGDLL